MQRDMHYYGTYAMAAAAGIPKNDANTIAYAAQFTDDVCLKDNVPNKDGGLMFGISTAHNPVMAAANLLKDYATNLEGQRKIWIPFHFLPGGKGNTFDEKVLCGKDSVIANEMFMNHIKVACSQNDKDDKKAYWLELLGICAHVYMDTYSHYGFSGISSKNNNVHQPTIEITNKVLSGDILNSFKKSPKDTWIKILSNDIWDRFKKIWVIIQGQAAEDPQKGALGHAGVDVYPDMPYLQWKFKFDNPRPGEDGTESVRDNQDSFLNACEKLHGYFARVTQKCYDVQNVKQFNGIKDAVKKLLSFAGTVEQREKEWLNSGLCEGVQPYNVETWNSQRDIFRNAERSEGAIATNIYRFHQAAAYHRYYVLKDLLPSHGIAAY